MKTDIPLKITRLRACVNKKATPNYGMASTALACGLLPGRREDLLRCASCIPHKSWASTAVIKWSSHTTTLPERNAHERTNHETNRSRTSRSSRTSNGNRRCSHVQTDGCGTPCNRSACSAIRKYCNRSNLLRGNPHSHSRACSCRSGDEASESSHALTRGTPSHSGNSESFISRSLLLIQKQIRPFNLYFCWYAANTPIAHALHSKWECITQPLGYFSRSAKLLNQFLVFFNLRIHGPILNAVFR